MMEELARLDRRIDQAMAMGDRETRVVSES